MEQYIKAVTLLDVAKGEVVMIKFTESEQQEMKQYDDFSVFLSTLEDIYQFKLSNCHYICSDNVRKIGYETTEEEYAQEVLRNDVIKSDGLEDYYQQQLDKATEDDKKELICPKSDEIQHRTTWQSFSSMYPEFTFWNNPFRKRR